MLENSQEVNSLLTGFDTKVFFMSLWLFIYNHVIKTTFCKSRKIACLDLNIPYVLYQSTACSILQELHSLLTWSNLIWTTHGLDIYTYTYIFIVIIIHARTTGHVGDRGLQLHFQYKSLCSWIFGLKFISDHKTVSDIKCRYRIFFYFQ